MATETTFAITKLEPRVAPTSGIFGAAESLNGDNMVDHVASESGNVSDALNNNLHVSDVGNGNWLGNANDLSATDNSIGNAIFRSGQSQ